jgi:hypothetical protein
MIPLSKSVLYLELFDTSIQPLSGIRTTCPIYPYEFVTQPEESNNVENKIDVPNVVFFGKCLLLWLPLPCSHFMIAAFSSCGFHNVS